MGKVINGRRRRKRLRNAKRRRDEQWSQVYWQAVEQDRRDREMLTLRLGAVEAELERAKHVPWPFRHTMMTPSPLEQSLSRHYQDLEAESVRLRGLLLGWE